MMKDEQKAVLLSLAVGAIAGFLSSYSGSLLGLILGIVIAFALNSVQKTRFKEKKKGWSRGNIIIPYVFVWIAVWIFLINL